MCFPLHQHLRYWNWHQPIFLNCFSLDMLSPDSNNSYSPNIFSIFGWLDEEFSLICFNCFFCWWFWSFDAFIQSSPKDEINKFGSNHCTTGPSEPWVQGGQIFPQSRFPRFWKPEVGQTSTRLLWFHFLEHENLAHCLLKAKWIMKLVQSFKPNFSSATKIRQMKASLNNKYNMGAFTYDVRFLGR